jgi:undecaprenyl-diphosphatase
MYDFINTIKELDMQLFLLLNSMHNSFFDEVMYWVSHKFFWIPLYMFLLFLVFKQSGKNTWIIAIFVALLVVLCDQLSVHAFKEVFLRYRPCHNLLIQSKVHLLNGHCGGAYGFVSSHASNTFGLAMFLTLLFKNKIKYAGLFLFVWAALVGYSRVYSGVHYPADIAVGAILGMGLGITVFKLYQRTMIKLQKDK